MVGMRPDQKMDRPPRLSCGFSPMKWAVPGLPLCQKVSQPKCRAKLEFGNRHML